MKAMKVLVVLMLTIFTCGVVNAQVHHVIVRHHKKRHVIVKRRVVVVKHHR
jgi:hypothetical protein